MIAVSTSKYATLVGARYFHLLMNLFMLYAADEHFTLWITLTLKPKLWRNFPVEM